MDNQKMHILATCQYGWPEPYPSMYPMEEMVKRGHYVHAITGTPNYPMGDVFKGYEHNRIKTEEHAGVHYSHVPVIPRKHDTIHRFLNYHSYPISAAKEIDKLTGDFDVVFSNQSSPVMMVEPAIHYAKKWNKKVVMYCMDLWPASLAVGGIKPGSPIYRYYYEVSKKIYTKVDKILVTSRLFMDYFINEFGIDKRTIDYLPQYALSEFDDIPAQSQKETTDFVFAGNVGKAQNLSVILKAAEIIGKSGISEHGKKIFFHIVGDGQELANLKEFAKEHMLDNVIFHGRRSSEEMPEFYALADAMMVTLIADPLVALTLPAKVQSYMAAGKPILASANGEIANVVKESKAGLCSQADDVQGFVNIVKEFITTDKRRSMGNNAKRYYDSNFSREKVMDKLEMILEENSH